MLCTDKGSMVQSTVLFWMDWVTVWHACSIPLFQDDYDEQTWVEQVYYPLPSIYYWLIYNVCKSDTSGNRLKVPFAVTRHKCTVFIEVLIFTDSRGTTYFHNTENMEKSQKLRTKWKNLKITENCVFATENKNKKKISNKIIVLEYFKAKFIITYLRLVKLLSKF